MHGLYYGGRGLNRELLHTLFNCQYVASHQSIILQGFTDSGKHTLPALLGNRPVCIRPKPDTSVCLIY